MTYTVPPGGLPAVTAPKLPSLPRRIPGLCLTRARAAEEAAIPAGQSWDGWFAVRHQIHPSQK